MNTNKIQMHTKHENIFMPKICKTPFFRQVKIQYIGKKNKLCMHRHLTCSKHTTYTKHIFLRVHEVFLSFFAKSDANICFSIHSVLLFKDTRAIIMLQYILFDIGSSGAKIQKKSRTWKIQFWLHFSCFLGIYYLEMLYVWVWVFLCEPEKKEFVFSR